MKYVKCLLVLKTFVEVPPQINKITPTDYLKILTIKMNTMRYKNT